MLGRKGKGSIAAKVLVWATIVMSVLVVFVVDFWVSWAAILFGMVLLVGLTVLRTRSIGHPTKSSFRACCAFCDPAVDLEDADQPRYLPAEVSPSASPSMRIAQQVLQDHPLFGSGPGTSIFDFRIPFTGLEPVAFWTIRFERGSRPSSH